jgi:hypothetical protein
MNSEGCRKKVKILLCLLNMTKDCGLLVNMFGSGECLKHTVAGPQLHIDYTPETVSVGR